MPYDLTIENPDHFFLITNRTGGSRLWFINNAPLQERICAHLAKYAKAYGVVVCCFIIMGNHYHLIAKFPRGRRSAFLRDFDSIIARLVRTYVKEFEGGTLWPRRPKCQILPNPEDVENWFFYVALNPVSSGLAQRLSDYHAYNSFTDAIAGRTRVYRVFRRKEFNDRRRFNPNLERANFVETFELSFVRLPGYEHLQSAEYRKVMLEKLERRRTVLVAERQTSGRGFAPARALAKTSRGSKPRSTKISARHSRRPLVLSVCRETRKMFLALYFATLEAYRKASALYRAGDRLVVFPPGTCLPSVPPMPTG